MSEQRDEIQEILSMSVKDLTEKQRELLASPSPSCYRCRHFVDLAITETGEEIIVNICPAFAKHATMLPTIFPKGYEMYKTPEIAKLCRIYETIPRLGEDRTELTDEQIMRDKNRQVPGRMKNRSNIPQ